MSDTDSKFDLGFLNKISGGDKAFIIDMINTFKEQVPEYIDQSKVYFEEKNYDALSRVAHKFLPGVSFLGIKFLEGDIALIEEYAKKQENLGELPKLLETSYEKIEEIVESLNKEFNL